MAEKKYLSLNGLAEYDALIKAEIENKISEAGVPDNVALWSQTDSEEVEDTAPIDADLLGGYPPEHYETITDDTTGLLFRIGIDNGALYCQQIEE